MPTKTIIAMAGAATWLLLAQLPASAGSNCYENLGCAESDNFSTATLRRMHCDTLWIIRNSIYDEHGYCFKSSRGQSYFDNSDCFINNAANVPLNRTERNNVAKIKKVEKAKGCR